ncbi:hypothetical protein M5K25_003541 [Dendrobium thyrsiflorum]|uniref:Glycylpeptide N-tetradecanoyltransferase n=1 Tax=Dendrobium thyrsiflorum TaxID=117978 RepID=A0ABD0VKU6_DENTH
MAEESSSRAATSGRKDQSSPAKCRPHRRFWITQPVVQRSGGTNLKDSPIKSPDSLSRFLNFSEHRLPDQFEWVSIDVNNNRSFHDFIASHYFDGGEEDIHVLNFPYSPDFLRWFLRAPGFIRSLHLGIREKSTKKLAGFIAGTPATIRIKTESHRVAVANLLCLDKAHRSKLLSCVLINELARRATVNEIWQGVYATEAPVSTPLCSCEWLQRLLNPAKLRKLGIFVKKNRKEKRSNVEIQNLPPEPETIGFRKMKRQDVAAVVDLLKEYLKTFTVAPVVDVHFVEHFLVPKQSLVYSYVVQDPETQEITDFCSFVIQKKEIMKRRKRWEVKCAVLFYYAASKTSLLNLIRDLITMACIKDCDIFRAQGIMGNDLFLDKLKFEPVPYKKVLHYHLYNYGLMNVLRPKELGLVLL